MEVVHRLGRNRGFLDQPEDDVACDLPAWLCPLALGGDLAAAEPRNIRYTLLRTAGRIILDQRRRRGRIPETWPWADALATVFTGTFALPAPT